MMEKRVETIEDVLSEMMQHQAALPSRPTPQEVQSSLQTIVRVEAMLAEHLTGLFAQSRPPKIPMAMFRALKEMREDVLRQKALADKQTAIASLEVEERHRHYEILIQRVYPATIHRHSSFRKSYMEQHSLGSPKRRSRFINEEDGDATPTLGRSESVLGRFSEQPEAPPEKDWRLVPGSPQENASLQDRSADAPSPRGPRESPTVDTQPLVASPQLLEYLERASAKKLEFLDLSDSEIKCLPESIGVLTRLTTLDLSGNHLPTLPETIGELTKLVHLDVMSNELTGLPESLGLLKQLKMLNIQKNSIQEIPYTIGMCKSLVCIEADFNQLKALPEAIGHLTSLQKLTTHLNCLQTLPSTVSSLVKLTELDVHFNHIQVIPEALRFCSSLTRLDVSSNFADLKALPDSIGQLQKLTELDASFNHLTVLPDSFALLTELRTLSLDGNPMKVPPMEVVMKGTMTVLVYMADLVERKVLEASEAQKPKSIGFNSLLNIFKRSPRSDNFDKLGQSLTN